MTREIISVYLLIGMAIYLAFICTSLHRLVAWQISLAMTARRFYAVSFLACMLWPLMFVVYLVRYR